jgi:hypothetical protein
MSRPSGHGDGSEVQGRRVLEQCHERLRRMMTLDHKLQGGTGTTASLGQLTPFSVADEGTRVDG